MYTYLLINLFSIAIPLILSFERRVHFVSKWKYLWPGLLLTSAVFLVWDHAFTVRGIWGFNSSYLIGWSLFSLPLEEILFFICIPFACLFIYELVCHFQKRTVFGTALRTALKIFIFGLIFAGMWSFHRAYTATTFFLLALFLAVHVYILRSKYLDRFFQMYLISLIPFLIVNGLLTNGLSFIDPGPAVWYNNAENLSLRVIGIPVEDFFYSMLMLLTNVTLYEYFQKR